MESAPQGNNESYNQNEVATAAMQGAAELLEERGLNELTGTERMTSIVNVMKELSADNANRHVVEALAQVLTIEQAKSEFQTKISDYPAAAELVADNDNRRADSVAA